MELKPIILFATRNSFVLNLYISVYTNIYSTCSAVYEYISVTHQLPLHV